MGGRCQGVGRQSCPFLVHAGSQIGRSMPGNALRPATAAHAWAVTAPVPGATALQVMAGPCAKFACKASTSMLTLNSGARTVAANDAGYGNCSSDSFCQRSTGCPPLAHVALPLAQRPIAICNQQVWAAAARTPVNVGDGPVSAAIAARAARVSVAAVAAASAPGS